MIQRRQESLISKNRKLIFNIMAAGVMGYAILLLFSIFNNAIELAAYPNEYREAANIFMTQSIVNGENIYSLDVLNAENPGLIYLYGPLNSIIASIITIIVPDKIILVHYLLSFVEMVIGAVLMLVMVREHTSTFFPGSVAFLFSIFCNWRYGYIYAAPDTLGFMMLVLFLFILSRKEFAFKPYLASIIAIAAFFTKQYFAVIALTGFLYYLFLSKKNLIKYTLSGVVITAILFEIISVKFPLYFTYALYFLKGPGAGAPSQDTNGKIHNASQFSYLGGIFIFLFIFVLIHTLGIAYRIYKKEIQVVFNFREISEPFISFENDEDLNFEILFYIQIVVALLILYYIGNNPGAFISYHLQLLMPGIIVIGLIASDNIRVSNKMINRWRVTILIVANLVMCIYTVNRAQPRLVVTKCAELDKERWDVFYDIVGQYDEEEIWYYPLGEYPNINTGTYMYNSGMPFVVSQRFLDKYNNSEFGKKYFPYAGRIMQQHLDYRQKVISKVKNGEYSLIMYMEDMDPVFTKEDLNHKYRHLITIPLKAGSWIWDLDLYVLKDDDTISLSNYK